MGLFNFVKSVGEKLGIGEQAPDAQSIKTALDGLNLGTENVKVAVENGKAILTGAVKDQATLEKAILAVGNLHSIESVNTDNLKVENGQKSASNQTAQASTAQTSSASQPSGSQPAEPHFYEVKKGDTLWKIAEEVYGKGHGDKNKIIFEANKPMLKSPEKIFPGQKLRIPDLNQA
ncbi:MULTISPECIES: peptidoglycan-binding protein LysM [Bartonella]|uniref:peptidoglycan-binding protein LysM n=1 Tax=Bartonella TaxID=773 RepID=UPI0018DE12A3|nr:MULTISPECIES: peptidoglycan-binding protein LysM [Bartonella]MBH9995361.1 peptidoglycan-binding protein LysM [Bartonella sp. P0291]MBH9996295.1 peptidoglycan-binding protein LysM [Bartonella sp. M0192]MBH9998456.1 peptidoglycan-binding protein LysM [Bartonella sp. M0191]MBI0007754.1 peptidoglycan-binding protein LysM [Bartonella sp. M0193]MBI0009746.1 peptidoglycan-binding protein LysM [Bartonella sp. M0176]